MGESIFRKALEDFAKNQDNYEKEYQKTLEKERQERKEKLQKEQKYYDSYTEETLNKLLYQMEINLETTKFKNRYKYIIVKDNLHIYLDNHLMLKFNIPDLTINCCLGDLAYKVSECFYKEENFWTLESFIKDYCIVLDKELEPNERLARKSFINVYKQYCVDILKTTKFVSFNQLNRLLEEKYNEKVIRYKGCACLSKIIIKPEIKQKLGIYEDFERTGEMSFSIDDNSLVDFIENCCNIEKEVPIHERLPRKTFNEAYDIYVKKFSKKPKVSIMFFNKILKEKYDENFIKSNGAWYMKKIKFKKF